MKLYRVTAAIDDVSGAVTTRTRFGTNTVFNATIDGQRQYAVQILGTVRVESGMIVTAVLRAPNDWQTLEGWRDHQSGRIEGVSSISSLRFAAILFGALFVAVVVLGFVFRSVAGEHLLAILMSSIFGAAALIPIVGWYRGMQVWDALGANTRLDRTASFEEIG
ncbi:MULTISPECIES: hypothetical protein [Burkholderia]|uniref:hypothetical protein n=1 Tax=Burkholderia TaxID=32008 RepID=UPI001581AB5A|nr:MULTISPECIES: hypothetical protein [Burkholderia]